MQWRQDWNSPRDPRIPTEVHLTGCRKDESGCLHLSIHCFKKRHRGQRTIKALVNSPLASDSSLRPVQAFLALRDNPAASDRPMICLLCQPGSGQLSYHHRHYLWLDSTLAFPVLGGRIFSVPDLVLSRCFPRGMYSYGQLVIIYRVWPPLPPWLFLADARRGWLRAILWDAAPNSHRLFR